MWYDTAKEGQSEALHALWTTTEVEPRIPVWSHVTNIIKILEDEFRGFWEDWLYHPDFRKLPASALISLFCAGGYICQTSFRIPASFRAWLAIQV